MKSFDKCFVTGCDQNTEWMLPWFMKNYLKHNDTPIVFADFGVSDATRAWAYQIGGFAEMFQVDRQRTGGWFYKPQALRKTDGKYVCWLDTDIHILGDMSGIFDHFEPNKLAMVEDVGWSKRRGETWHNSGVVGIIDKPNILTQWEQQCKINPSVGDQEVLHEMVRVSPLARMTNITSLPNIYNWMRLQILDGQDNPNKLAMHWTGFKGKEQIRKIMYHEKK